MKKKLSVAAGLIILIAIISWTSFITLTRNSRDWTFI